MKERLLVRTAVAVMLLAFHGWSMPAAARSVPAGDSGIVLRVTNGSGDSLAPAERQAVEEVLLARAWEAGVVVCHDGLASPGPPAVAGICADPNSEAAPFWWDLEVETTRRERTWMASATLRLALSDGPPRKAPEIFLLGPFVLPPGVAAGGALGEALRAATASLRSSPALLGWLDGLAGRPGLPHIHPLPSKEAAGPQNEVPAEGRRPVAPAAPPPDDRAGEADAWKAEVLRITDLLIEGNPWQAREAGERADRLLRGGRLPADLVDRVRELKEKAAAKLASEPAQSLPAEPPTPPPAALPAAEEPGSQRADRTFPARLGVAGKGFDTGPEGQLRLAREGISFHRSGRSAADWSVSWADLTSASRDDGLWESPFTILLVERTGNKRYLSLTDGHGHYVAGDPLLSAIAAGKKAFRRSPGEAAGGGDPKKRQGEKP
jgi:hypothetical protein